ncbi:DUF2861 family protein [Vibrio penaeicida]|uniref:DUF2861 family protein n=1 Tax=Vibrio penaeicida TaxID=104609 RepID=UPI000CE9C319|nr:DUF2861 family protein [Vibrio penaeicida]
MKKDKFLLGLVSTALIFSQQVVAEDWFMKTPLAATYSALSTGNTQLAWQEMLIALSQNSLDEKHWAKPKEVMINQSQCGKQLIPDHPINHNSHIRITIQKKTNFIQQGYQIKVSLDGVENSVSISLRDRHGRVWISGTTSDPVQSYTELESDDLVYAPTSGYYQLIVDKAVYPIILSSNDAQAWVNVDHSDPSLPIRIRLPETPVSCQVGNMRWQWFDNQFVMLGNSQPIYLNAPSVDSNGFAKALEPESTKYQAKWLSAVVSKWEYQGTVKIEYVQRTTLPL